MLTGLTEDQIEALIAHELAHVRRHDFAINLLQTALEALLFYHPAVWWVSKGIRAEREYCCDDMALRVTTDEVAYARALTTLESWRGAEPQIGMSTLGGSLMLRIQRMLGLRPSAPRARVPLTAFDVSSPRPVDWLEYLARDGQWAPGLDPSDGLLIMEDNASEMTVRYHPEIGRWLALYSYPNLNDPFPRATASGVVTIRTAERLEGPWSEPKSVYQIPELEEDYAAGYDPNTFCYAAKEHPEYAREGRLLFTYVCNLFTNDGEDPYAVLKRLAEKMHLYRPNAISIPFPTLELE